jgi:hypothetical protein
MRVFAPILTLLALCACSDAEVEETPESKGTVLVFTLENIAEAGSLDGEDVLYAPGVWAAHTGASPLFAAGSPASAGLEALAEDGMTSPMLEEAREGDGVVVAGTFGQVETGVSYEENPIAPGSVAGFQFRASPGQRLSLATMFIQSNDVFLGTDAEGIELFDGDAPRVGTHEAQLAFWDAGTEVNEPPGEGANQAPRQSAANTGPDEGATVEKFESNTDGDGHVYPAPTTTVRLTIAVEQAP